MMPLLTEKTEHEFLAKIAHLRRLFEAGDGNAGYALAIYIDPHNEAIPLGWRQRAGASDSECRRVNVETFHLLEAAAKNGDAESMHLVAQYYQTGMPPVATDMGACRDWCERAVAAGYAFAANDLYSLYSDPKSLFFDEDKARRYKEIVEKVGQRVVR